MVLGTDTLHGPLNMSSKHHNATTKETAKLSASWMPYWMTDLETISAKDLQALKVKYQSGCFKKTTWALISDQMEKTYIWTQQPFRRSKFWTLQVGSERLVLPKPDVSICINRRCKVYLIWTYLDTRDRLPNRLPKFSAMVLWCSNVWDDVPNCRLSVNIVHLATIQNTCFGIKRNWRLQWNIMKSMNMLKSSWAATRSLHCSVAPFRLQLLEDPKP